MYNWRMNRKSVMIYSSILKGLDFWPSFQTDKNTLNYVEKEWSKKGKSQGNVFYLERIIECLVREMNDLKEEISFALIFF